MIYAEFYFLIIIANMIGDRPTLQDIVLSEVPSPVDLFCHEQLPSEEELESLDAGDSQSHQQLQVFVIESVCGHCERRIKLSATCSNRTIRQLQLLLCQDLDFLCSDCYQRQ